MEKSVYATCMFNDTKDINDEEFEQQLTPIVGDDVNAEPSKAHAVVLSLVDEMIWSKGLRRAIIADLTGECPGEEMRKQLIYDMLWLTHATKEEVFEIFSVMEQDKIIFPSEVEDEDEDDKYDDENEDEENLHTGHD